MPEFKYQIGELVTTRQVLAEIEMAAKIGEARCPKALMIIERLTQECPGGVQLHYALSYDGSIYRVNEIEVAPLSEFDASAVVAAVEAVNAAPTTE